MGLRDDPNVQPVLSFPNSISGRTQELPGCSPRYRAADN
jgi:hypothetical protein